MRWPEGSGSEARQVRADEVPSELVAVMLESGVGGDGEAGVRRALAKVLTDVRERIAKSIEAAAGLDDEDLCDEPDAELDEEMQYRRQDADLVRAWPGSEAGSLGSTNLG